MIMGMRHVGIVVKNLKESLQFYNLLGFKANGQKQIREPSDYIDKLSAGKNISLTTLKLTAPDNSMVELLDYEQSMVEEKQTLFGTGITHIAFTVKSIEKVYTELLSKGIKFNSSPQMSSNGYAKVVFCKAPEGSFIELVEIL